MGFHCCVSLALPVLKEKLRALHLASTGRSGQPVVDVCKLEQQLGKLEQAVQRQPTLASLQEGEVSTGRSLVRALGGVSLRTLFTTLYRLVPTEHEHVDIASALKCSMAVAGLLDEASSG